MKLSHAWNRLIKRLDPWAIDRAKRNRRAAIVRRLIVRLEIMSDEAAAEGHHDLADRMRRAADIHRKRLNMTITWP